MYTLHNGDAFNVLRELPDNHVDLIVTDPPYESLEKHRRVGTTTRLSRSRGSSNDWFPVIGNERLGELLAHLYRVLKPNAHAYVFSDSQTFPMLWEAGVRAGFRFWKPLVWDKCLGPETPVWTTRGTIPIKDVVAGDEVALPAGGVTRVQATRRTRAEAVRLTLTDGTSIVASLDHRFMRADGSLAETHELKVGDALARRAGPLAITAIEAIGEQDLVDISVADTSELFLLGNGVVSHNCKIGMGYHYRGTYEFVLFFEKGKRKLADLGQSDILRFPRLHNAMPAEKPRKLLEVLVAQSSSPGELVLDPFMGSGSTGHAAVALGRKFLGVEIKEDAYRHAHARIASVAA